MKLRPYGEASANSFAQRLVLPSRLIESNGLPGRVWLARMKENRQLVAEHHIPRLHRKTSPTSRILPKVTSRPVLCAYTT